MNWPGIVPPLTSSRNSNPPPRGSGSTRRKTSPNWPAPPVCFLWRGWASGRAGDAPADPVFGARGDRLAVRDLRRARLHFDAVALLHALEHQFEMQIRKPADHALVQLLVVLDAKARIFLAEPLQRGCELLLLTLVRGLDREAEHRHREIERLQVDLVLVVRIVQHGVEMDFLDLRDGGDVARNGLLDLGVILAAKLEEVADLERFLAVVDEELRIFPDHALVDAEHAE